MRGGKVGGGKEAVGEDFLYPLEGRVGDRTLGRIWEIREEDGVGNRNGVRSLNAFGDSDDELAEGDRNGWFREVGGEGLHKGGLRGGAGKGGEGGGERRQLGKGDGGKGKCIGSTLGAQSPAARVARFFVVQKNMQAVFLDDGG